MGPLERQSTIDNRQSAIPIASGSLPGLPLAPQSESAGLQLRRACVDACGAGHWMVRRLANSFKADPGERSISFPWLPGWPGATGGRRRGSSLAVPSAKQSDMKYCRIYGSPCIKARLQPFRSLAVETGGFSRLSPQGLKAPHHPRRPVGTA